MKKNNKGFSLVELIIVIAIMAVLVAVLAPQYTKYVEKSRQSVDINAVDGILGACKTIAIDPETYDAASAGFTVTWKASDNTVTSSVAALTTPIAQIVGTTIEHKGKDFKDVAITYNPANYTFTVDTTCTYISSAFNS